MKIYCEAIEQVPYGEEGEFARIDVSDYMAAEKEQILAALKDLMPGCIYQEHTCYHEESKACQLRTLP